MGTTCWKWGGFIGKRGYGEGPQRQPAHRFVYEVFNGSIPPGIEIDHLCHNTDPDCAGGWTCPHRACVNPEHLEAVTHLENVLRGKATSAQQARRDHCIHGHLLVGPNVYIRKRARGRTSRQCLVCGRIRRKTPAALAQARIQDRRRRERKRAMA